MFSATVQKRIGTLTVRRNVFKYVFRLQWFKPQLFDISCWLEPLWFGFDIIYPINSAF